MKLPLYLETDVSGIGLSTALLQTRYGMTCSNCILKEKSDLHRMKIHNNKREALGILFCLERFHHYCFDREVSIITNHIPLVAIFKKEVATLLQRIQCILLRILQFQVIVIYKPGPELFIANWLSRHNHTGNKDAEIHIIDIEVDTIQTTTNIPECMSIPQIQQATAQDDNLQQLKGYIIVGWPENKDQIP